MEADNLRQIICLETFLYKWFLQENVGQLKALKLNAIYPFLFESLQITILVQVFWFISLSIVSDYKPW